ncbi:MAG: hypothetical protein R3A44_31665 [Caldilineaceae bacterium]
MSTQIKAAQTVHKEVGQGQHQIDDNYNFHDASFRRHYQLNYRDNGRDYEEFYAAAYRFGYQLSEQNTNASWEQLAQQAQSHWATLHASSWRDVAEAVRYGWTEERNPDKLRVHHDNGFEQSRPAFENHFSTVLEGVGTSFDAFVPIYSYGYNLAVDPAYGRRGWNDVELEVQAMWEREYHSRFMWEDYRSAVQHAWEEARARSANK